MCFIYPAVYIHCVYRTERIYSIVCILYIVSSNTTLNGSRDKELGQNAIDNLQLIEEEIETSSLYFKPNPGKTYLIRMNPQKDKIIPTENEKFKDTNGKPIKRYECKITHVNNDREQTWTVSKTVCLQIIEQLRKGFTVLKVTRQGPDRSTTYAIDGIQ